MRTQQISYDLIKPGKDYSDLIARIQTMGSWCHALLSVWLVRTEMNSEAVRNYLSSAIDTTDKMLIIEVTADASAWTRTLPTDVQAWLWRTCRSSVDP